MSAIGEDAAQPPPVPEPGLGARAARGALVTGGSQAVRLAVQVLSVVVLARFLSPSDYGLVAMVLAVIGVGEILRELGLSPAAVQAPTLSRAQRDNLFWLNTAAGMLLSCSAAAAAPVIAAMYGRPETLWIALALSPTFTTSGLATQYRADLTRRMRFVDLAVAEVVASVVSLAAGLAAAASGMGYWSLVVQQVLSGVVVLVLYVARAGWVPGWWSRAAPMRDLLTFGWSVLGSQLLTYAGNNLDSAIIGARFGAAELGLYNRGLQLIRVPMNQMRAPMTTVAQPVLASLQSDRRRFLEFASRAQLAVCYPILAALALVVAAPGPIAHVALGDRWLGITPYLRLVAIGEAAATLSFVGYWMYLSLGLGRALLRFTAWTVVVRIAAILVGAAFGPLGVATAYAAVPSGVWLVSLWQIGRVSGLPTGRLIANVLRVLAVTSLASLAAWGAGLWFRPASAWSALLLAGGAFLVAFALAGVVPRVRRDLREMVSAAALVRRRA